MSNNDSQCLIEQNKDFIGSIIVKNVRRLTGKGGGQRSTRSLLVFMQSPRESRGLQIEHFKECSLELKVESIPSQRISRIKQGTINDLALQRNGQYVRPQSERARSADLSSNMA